MKNENSLYKMNSKKCQRPSSKLQTWNECDVQRLKLSKTIARCEALEEPNVQMIIKWVAMSPRQMWEYNANIMKAKALVEGLAFEAYVQMILNIKTKKYYT